MSPRHSRGFQLIISLPSLQADAQVCWQGCVICAGIFFGSYKCDIIPPQSLHYSAANNTTDKAGMALRASLQVIITFGQIAFCVTER